MTDADLTLKILQTIRDDVRAFRGEILGEFGVLRSEVHEFRGEFQEFRTETRESFEMTNSRLEIIEHTLSGHTQQLASIARLVNNAATRREVAELRARIDKLESD
ncbi:MAG: hypothetical protein ABI678_03985 [Kofleriaceae bacterium]